MSYYEKYDDTSKNYDKTRIPIGVEIIVRCLAKSGQPIDQFRLLDAGCGTCNYSVSLLDHVKHVEAVDLSGGMLRAARSKLKSFYAEGRINLHQARIDYLPFKDATFDAVMVNVVLHHIEDQTNNSFPTHRRVLREIHRVLKPGGVLSISTASHEQLRYGYWFYSLIPEAVNRALKGYIPLDMLREMLYECGLTYHGSSVPLDAVSWGDSYFDPYGPLKKEWRDGESMFALATEQELKRMYKQIREMDTNGELSRYLAEHDTRRHEVGQVTFLCASRD